MLLLKNGSGKTFTVVIKIEEQFMNTRFEGKLAVGEITVLFTQ